MDFCCLLFSILPFFNSKLIVFKIRKKTSNKPFLKRKYINESASSPPQEFWKINYSWITTTGTQVVSYTHACTHAHTRVCAPWVYMPKTIQEHCGGRGKRKFCSYLFIDLFFSLLRQTCCRSQEEIFSLSSKQPGFTFLVFKEIIFKDVQLLWIGVTFQADGYSYLSTAVN